jgi:hypothetical protein
MFEEFDGVTVALVDLGAVAGALSKFDLPILGVLPALDLNAVNLSLGGTADVLSVSYISFSTREGKERFERDVRFFILLVKGILDGVPAIASRSLESVTTLGASELH